MPARLFLLAVVGASGAGKSTFVRAGLLPAAPEGWGHLIVKPGSSPFVTLAQALVPVLAGDTEAMQQIVRFEEPKAALRVIGRWRARQDETLLVVD